MKKNLYPKIHIQEIQRNQTLICNGVTLTVCADVGDPGQWSLVIQKPTHHRAFLLEVAARLQAFL